MGFPALDIAVSNKPIAFLITEQNELKIIQLKKITHGFFVDKDHGVFLVDPTKGLKCDKVAIYVYDVRTAKPIDWRVHAEIDEFCKKNGLYKVSAKDAKHGGLLRKLIKKNNGDKDKALQELSQSETSKKETIENEIEGINQSLLQENETRLKNQEAPIEIKPDDYASFVLEKLIERTVITREEAQKIKFELTNGQITIDDFINKLSELHKVEIHEAITANAQRYIDEHKVFDPAKVMTYIKMAKGLGKDIKDLGQPVVKNLVPLKWIFGVGLIIVIVAVVMTSLDFGQIGELIPIFSSGNN